MLLDLRRNILIDKPYYSRAWVPTYPSMLHAHHKFHVQYLKIEQY